MTCRPLLTAWALSLVIAAAAAQEIAPSRSVRFRVVDVHGRPIDGACAVRDGAVRTVDEVLDAPHARAGEDGELRLDVVGEELLWVAAPGRVAMRIELLPGLLGSSATPEPPNVVLPEGAVLAGTVVDTDGRPLAGATVTAQSLLGVVSVGLVTMRPVAVTQTDARGAFRLHGAPTAAVQLDVRLDGYARWSMHPVALGVPLRAELEPTGWIEGLALGPDGTPLAGLRLEERYECVPATDDTWSVTDAEGRFRIPRAHPGRMRLFGELSDFSALVVGPVLEAAADDVIVRGVETVHDVASTPTHVQVTVRDAGTGRPIPGACVAIRRAPDRGRGLQIALPGFGGPWDSASRCPASDDRGRVRLHVPGYVRKQGAGELRVRAVGYAACFEVRDLDPADAEVEIALQPEAVVAGAVLDRQGAPVVGARVFWIRRAEGSASIHFGGQQVHAVRTDREGRYELRGLPRGELEVLASHQDFVLPPAVRLDTTEAAHGIADFRLDPVPRMRLRLPPSWDSEPATVWLLGNRRWSGGARDQQAEFQGDDFDAVPVGGDGIVEFPLRDALTGMQPRVERLAHVPHPYLLRFELPRFDPRKVDGGEVVVEEAELATGRAHGRVLADGIPTERLAVRATDLDAERQAQRPFGFVVPVDVAGRFAFELLPGRFELGLIDLLTCQDVALAVDEVLVEAGSDQELRLEPDLITVNVRLASISRETARRSIGALWHGPGGIEAGVRWPLHLPLTNGSGRDSFELFFAPTPMRFLFEPGVGRLLRSGLGPRTRRGIGEFVPDAREAQEFVLSIPDRVPTAEIDG